MMKSSYMLAMLLLAFLLNLSTHAAFGHGSGFETLPPKMLGDRKVAMEVSSSVDNETSHRQVTFSMFDTNSGITIRDVTYHVKTIKNNNVIFEGNYQTGNGGLTFDMIPTESEQVTTAEKNNAGFFEAIIGEQKNTVESQGKIFKLGGLYKFSIDVVSAESYSAKTSTPVHFDAGISFPETVSYQINDKYFGAQQVKVVSYYDILGGVSYDPKTKSVEFSMPFEWSASNINQTSILHEEVSIPKTFGSLQVSEYAASVNGMATSNQTLTVDDFQKDNRVIHILLYRSELMRLFEAQSQKSDKINFSLFPKSDDFVLSATTENVEYKVVLTTDPKQISSGDDADISFKIYDVFLQGKTVSVPYHISVVTDSKEIFKSDGTSDDSATWDKVRISVPSGASGKFIVKFENLGGNDLAKAEIPIAIAAQPTVPGWIKNDARWWCDGSISDGEFLHGMGYLVGQKVIQVSEVPDGNTAKEIPNWIKADSCSWASGSISDGKFLSGIEYLIKNGMIRI